MITLPSMGLKAWNLVTDLFDHTQLEDNWTAIDQHNHSSGQGNQIGTGGIQDGAITDAKIANATITADKLASGVLGSRGASRIATSQSTSSTTYTTLATPDQVTVTLSATGYLDINFQALWQEPALAHARAAIFIGSSQQKVYTDEVIGPPVTAAAYIPASSGYTSINQVLFSTSVGLVSTVPLTSSTNASKGPDATTGQALGFFSSGGSDGTVGLVLDDLGIAGGPYLNSPAVNYHGGPCKVYVASPGTYTVSVRFRTTTGSPVTVSNRKLWVEARD